MIQIKPNNLETIALDYFNEIKAHCAQAAKFHLAVYQVIDTASTYELLQEFKLLHGNTKKAILNIYLKNKVKKLEEFIKIKKSNFKSEYITHRDLFIKIANFLTKEDKLKAILLCKPGDSIELENKIKVELGINSSNFKYAAQFINTIINYDQFDKFAYSIGERIGTITCPYCNRIFINTVQKETAKERKKGIIRPQFDHFFPQSKHPILALSFYNLIPSCYFCNANLKGGKSMSLDTHIHPYLEGFEDTAHFSIDLTAFKANKNDSANFDLKLAEDLNLSANLLRKIHGTSKDEGNKQLFQLEEIYKAHKDIVGEIIDKCEKSNNSYVLSLKEMFFQDLDTNDSEFYQFYFGNYFNKVDFCRRPLAKFYKDIIMQVLPHYTSQAIRFLNNEE